MRHGFTPRCLFRRGRRASGTACPRGAWARECSPDLVLPLPRGAWRLLQMLRLDRVA
ncbi:hypothetical protein CC205_10105 [Pseudomonas savastanoi pv. nerii]|uniref:DUF1472 domain-containing protein n=1 Tax=Pseudomonas savastanoi pv. nerii TaxID=360921 RepID=A0AB73RNC0_PSESS|nr:hypothetical protein CC205_10105 [Pseudomonas savastanoi pv. nerii]